MIMGLAFLVLTLLSGCGKSEKQKCEAKGDTWSWDGSDNTCKEKDSSTQGTGTTAKTSESCQSQSGGYVWDSSNSQCKKVDYFMVIYKDMLVNVYLVKDISLVKEDTVPEDTNTEALVSMREKNQNRCVKVHESHLPKLIVRASKAGWFSVSKDEVCRGATAAESKCELGVYEVVSENDDNFSLKKANLVEERTDCVTLEPSSN